MSQPADFYVTGGSLRPDAPSYVERRADSDLHEGLTRGDFCYVLTPRQMGKSSLLVRAAHRLRANGRRVAVLDLTAIGRNLTPEQWYFGLLERLGEQLDIEAELERFWLSHTGAGPLQRFFQALVEVALPRCDGNLVVFVDEIDVVVSLPFSTDELFAAIRELYNRRPEQPALEKLTFCLSGVAAPTDLVRDPRITPFNIGRRIELDDFTEEEAGVLEQGLPGAGTARKGILRRVLYWTSGHPYLTQRLCKSAAEAAVQANIGPADVDRICRDLFLSRRAQSRDDNLIFVRDRLLRSELDLTATLDAYRMVLRGRRVADEDASPVIGLLRLSGIIRSRRGRLSVRNRVYGTVFNEGWAVAHMPDAEVRRQRAAYRRGVARTASAAAAILLLMGSLVVAALRYAWKADREHRLADRRAAEARQLASDLREKERQKEAALIALRQAVQSERARAREAKSAAEMARNARDRAVRESARADRETAIGRVRLARLTVTAGQRSLEDGYVTEALLQFVQALQLDAGHPDRTEVDRIRIGMLLDQQLSPNVDSTTRARMFPGHATCAYFSPDGRRLVVGHAEGTAEVWDTGTWRPVCRPLPHGNRVEEAAFSPDGRAVATVGQDGRVCVWEAGGGRLLAALPHDDVAHTVTFSRDGRWLATTTAAAVYVWDLAHRRSRWSSRCGKTLLEAAFSPDGRRLMTWDKRGRIEVRSLASGALIAAMRHDDQVMAASFSPDGRRIVSGSLDETVRMWDADTGRPKLPPIPLGCRVLHVCFSPDGRRIAACGGNINASFRASGARIWDAATGVPLSPLLPHRLPCRHVSFSPDGRLLATGSNEHAVRLWDGETGDPVTEPITTNGEVFYTAVSRGNRHLMAACNNGSIQVWDIANTRRPSGELMTFAEKVAGRRVDPQGGFSPPSYSSADFVKRLHGVDSPAPDPLENPAEGLNRVRESLSAREGSPKEPAAYDASRDFSAQRNPNGPWSYGCRERNGRFAIYDQLYNDAVDAWHLRQFPSPSVVHNGSQTTFPKTGPMRSPSGSLSLNPGVTGTYRLHSVVRWTAPASGEYRIAAAFYGLDATPTTSDVHIEADGRRLFDAYVEGTGSHLARYFCGTIALSAGDHVDFMVGPGRNGQFDNDSTALEARIRPVPASKEARAR